jgi:hypothetical protein
MTKELFGNRQKAKKMAMGGTTSRKAFIEEVKAGRKSAAIDAGQKGRTTSTPKTQADRYDRKILKFKDAGEPFNAFLLSYAKDDAGLKNANPPGPQRTAKLTPKKMAMGGLATPTDMMNTRGRDIAAMAQQGGMKMATSSPSRIVPGGMPPRGMGANPQNMKKGGSVRGCGCAVRGKNGAKVY